MKHTTFRLHFRTGHKRVVHAFGLKEAIILGLAEQIQEGLHTVIDRVERERDGRFEDLDVPATLQITLS